MICCMNFLSIQKKKYNVKAGFFTMNHVKLHDVLVNKLGLVDPIIISSINQIGFRMNPSQVEVESALKKKDSYNIAMSFLASGAIRPKEAIDYIGSLDGVDTVLFGASSPANAASSSSLFISSDMSNPLLRRVRSHPLGGNSLCRFLYLLLL